MLLRPINLIDLSFRLYLISHRNRIIRFTLSPNCISHKTQRNAVLLIEFDGISFFVFSFCRKRKILCFVYVKQTVESKRDKESAHTFNHFILIELIFLCSFATGVRTTQSQTHKNSWRISRFFTIQYCGDSYSRLQ